MASGEKFQISLTEAVIRSTRPLDSRRQLILGAMLAGFDRSAIVSTYDINVRDVETAAQKLKGPNVLRAIIIDGLITDDFPLGSLPKLDANESQVWLSLAQGWERRVTAEKLGTSIEGVKFIERHVYKKWGLKGHNKGLRSVAIGGQWLLCATKIFGQVRKVTLPLSF